MSSNIKEDKKMKQTKLPFKRIIKLKNVQKLSSKNHMQISFSHGEPKDSKIVVSKKPSTLPKKENKSREEMKTSREAIKRKQENKKKKNSNIYREKRAEKQMGNDLNKWLYNHSRTGWANPNSNSFSGLGIGGGGWKLDNKQSTSNKT